MASDHLWQGWPVELCSELGYDWGKCIFLKYLFISNPKFSGFSEKFFIWIEDFSKVSSYNWN